jgi:CRISPR/Cas system-associated endonuclease Cas1
MAANTPADLNKAAGWMSNDDLGKAAKGLFSFNSTNERDQAGRIALVKELAARGIDPHTLGYKGGPVVLNPNPKKDPVAKAAATVQKAADTAQKKADNEAAKAAKAVQQAQTQAQTAQAKAEKEKQKAQDAASKKLAQQAKDALAQDIASGKITEQEARSRMALLK